MKGFFKGFGIFLLGAIGVSAFVALVWGALYTTVPPVQNWTDDKVFNAEENIENPTEDETIITDAQGNMAILDYENRTIIIGG